MPGKEKGCRLRSRGTKDQLLIDKEVIKNCKRRKSNLNMASIEFRKSYEMVLHSWMIKSLELAGAAKNVVNLLKKPVKNWKTNLICSNTELGAVDINRGIFQGDSLSPLLIALFLLTLALVLRKIKQDTAIVKKRAKKRYRKEQGKEKE